MSDSSENQDDDREFRQGLYENRGRADSLGKDTASDYNRDDGQNDDTNYEPPYGSDEPYVPKKRDTFQLRRGSVDSQQDMGIAQDTAYGYGGGVQQETGPVNRARSTRQRLDSDVSDGDGGGYGLAGHDQGWSEASGRGGDFMYNKDNGSENPARHVSQNIPHSPLKTSLLVDDDMIMTNNQDLVEQIAEEKEKAKRQEIFKRRFYQGIVFLICYTLNFINRIREQFIYIWKDCLQDSKPPQNMCNDFQYSIMISSGIGFIFLGNIYDNIEKPRQVTTLLLVIISIITLIEAIFSNEFVEEDSEGEGQINVSFTLFQMSSLFEAGITLVCIVILHNWFKEEILGTVTAIWYSSQYLQIIAQQLIYDSIPHEDKDKQGVVNVIKYEGYALCGFYMIFAVICWFFFWHHPSHIGIKIRANADNSNSFGFVVDNTTTAWKTSAVSGQNARNINSTIMQGGSGMHPSNHQSRFGGDEDIIPDNDSQEEEMVKMDVTLIDAFKIKEINLLIASYIFAMCHNLYILKSQKYVGMNIDQRWFAFGSIIGIIASGILVDVVFKKKRFLTILLLNFLITVIDVYLYFQDFSEQNISPSLTFILGMVMSSINIVYLILLPMLIAKQHSEEMALTSDFARVSYAGTIVGVVIALCAVGKYLFSDNLATLLDFWTLDMSWKGYADMITSLLQLITVLIIFGPIRSEFKDSHIFSSLNCCCCKEQKDEEDSEDEQIVICDNSKNNSGNYGKRTESLSNDPKSK